jgi:DNA polymerase-1
MQSLAADIIKIAMVRLHREIEADQIEGRMLLQVHDELLFEVPRAELDQFAEKVPRVMTGAYELETGIEVEMKAGPNWADMKSLQSSVPEPPNFRDSPDHRGTCSPKMSS